MKAVRQMYEIDYVFVLLQFSTISHVLGVATFGSVLACMGYLHCRANAPDPSPTSQKISSAGSVKLIICSNNLPYGAQTK